MSVRGEWNRFRNIRDCVPSVLAVPKLRLVRSRISRDSVSSYSLFGMATGSVLDRQGIGVQFPARVESRPALGPTSLLCNGHRVLSPRG
jgi:hypothetical protein